MKKHYIIASLGALALVACSENGLVSEPDVVTEPTAEVPMLLDYHVGNLGRANKGLETEAPAFGVFAIKADRQADINLGSSGQGANVVMWDYLVGFWGGTESWGYKPNVSQELYGTKWYYEGLGKKDSVDYKTYTWVDGDVFKKAIRSRNDNQYLKYWDKSKIYTYFYAYTPYTAAATLSKDATTNETKLTFPEIKGQEPWPGNGAATGAQYMYAVAKETNETMISDKKKVDLTFTHLNSQIRLGFYEAVPGYSVDIQPLNDTPDDATGNAKYPYVYCVPTNVSDEGTYSVGSYLNKATATVTFNETTSAVSYTTSTDSYVNKPITHPYNWWDQSPKTLIPEGYANRMVGDMFNVIPADKSTGGTPNSGFTLNVSLKFTADDTKEVFYVYGARVFVPATYTQWEPNKLYTYVFKITKNVTGDTGTPNVEPEPGPGTSALWPIIFDQMEVSDYVEEIDKSLGDIQF